MSEKITAALRQVADKIDELRDVNFKQEPEDIEYDLLGNQSYPRKSGIVDRLQDSFDELQNTIDDQEKELVELKEFAKLISDKRVDMSLFRDYDLDIYEYNTDYVEDVFRLTQKEFDLIKKVVEKYESCRT